MNNKITFQKFPEQLKAKSGITFLAILNENNLIHFQKSIFEEVLMNSCFIFGLE